MHGDHLILMKNTETIDSYVTRIRQVVALLGYEEPQVLEVFKNTLPTKLYWIFISNRRPKTSCRNSKVENRPKEKLNKQLTGQISASPFMNI